MKKTKSQMEEMGRGAGKGKEKGRELQKRGGEHAASPLTGSGNIAKSVCLACLDRRWKH